MNLELLKSLDFSDKQAKVYITLLQLGPTSVRDLAEQSNLNRGTTYDALNWLRKKNLVGFFNKDKKRHFVAKDPDKLKDLIKKRKQEIDRIDKKLDQAIPELEALLNKGKKPVAKYYEKDEIADILEDVLSTCAESKTKQYRIYSAEGVREYLYKDFPSFSEKRIEKSINVKVLAIGEGGELRGLDERKWIEKENNTPTYILIYPGKTAYISLDAKEDPFGVVIDNEGVYETQKFIFDQLWNKID